MTRYQVRSLCTSDFEALQRLESEIFGAAGEDVLCPHYLRLCTDIFPDSCFVALSDDRAVGYLLCFIRGRDAYCTTLAVAPEAQRTRLTPMLIGTFVRTIMEQVDVCWFTVKPDNKQARALHAMLGAVEVGEKSDFYGPGDVRIVSKIDRARFEAMRPKYERLGLIPRKDAVAA